MDWTALGSIATGIGVIVAVEASRREHKHSRIALAVELLLRYEHRFESDEWRRTRVRAALFLIGRDGDEHKGERAVTDVLNFFEMLCSLVDQKVLELRPVWHSFGGWMLSYRRLAEQHIAKWQAENAANFKDFCTTCDNLMRIEVAERCLVAPGPEYYRQEDLEFAEREARLLSI